jgi:hypothetical protein
MVLWACRLNVMGVPGGVRPEGFRMYPNCRRDGARRGSAAVRPDAPRRGRRQTRDPRARTAVQRDQHWRSAVQNSRSPATCDFAASARAKLRYGVFKACIRARNHPLSLCVPPSLLAQSKIRSDTALLDWIRSGSAASFSVLVRVTRLSSLAALAGMALKARVNPTVKKHRSRKRPEPGSFRRAYKGRQFVSGALPP